LGVSGRYVDIDRARAFMHPGRSQAHNVGALGCRQAAPRMADEDDDGAVLFLDRDRVALLVVVGNGSGDCFIGMGAGAKCDCNADERAADAEGTVAILPQSVMKP
jgi:hypothetical protein